MRKLHIQSPRIKICVNNYYIHSCLTLTRSQRPIGCVRQIWAHLLTTYFIPPPPLQGPTL